MTMVWEKCTCMGILGVLAVGSPLSYFKTVLVLQLRVLGRKLPQSGPLCPALFICAPLRQGYLGGLQRE